MLIIGVDYHPSFQQVSFLDQSRVRTEFRLRLPEPIHKSPLESRGPTLLCNHVDSGYSFAGVISDRSGRAIVQPAIKLQFMP
jgi:hypothetical protein